MQRLMDQFGNEQLSELIIAVFKRYRKLQKKLPNMNLICDLSTFQNPIILSMLQQLPRQKTAEEKRQLRSLMNEFSIMGFED